MEPRDEPVPHVAGYLNNEDLIERNAPAGRDPVDMTRQPLELPADRALRLQALARGDEGFLLSPGTLYPMLLTMERDGYLTSHTEREGRTSRKFYTITAKGRDGLAVARGRLRDLRGDAGAE
jgi:hypothetical protein